MILAGFFIVSGVGLMAYYLWFLTWPRVTGAVDQVERGISDLSSIRSPRAYRLVHYHFDLNGVPRSSARQGLFVGAALGPRKKSGDRLRVSVCHALPQLSCPFRPIFELVILLAMLVLLFGVAAMVMFL